MSQVARGEQGRGRERLSGRVPLNCMGASPPPVPNVDRNFHETRHPPTMKATKHIATMVQRRCHPLLPTMLLLLVLPAAAAAPPLLLSALLRAASSDPRAASPPSPPAALANACGGGARRGRCEALRQAAPLCTRVSVAQAGARCQSGIRGHRWKSLELFRTDRGWSGWQSRWPIALPGAVAAAAGQPPTAAPGGGGGAVPH